MVFSVDFFGKVFGGSGSLSIKQITRPLFVSREAAADETFGEGLEKFFAHADNLAFGSFRISFQQRREIGGNLDPTRRFPQREFFASRKALHPWRVQIPTGK
jgi:hypothetical protein